MKGEAGQKRMKPWQAGAGQSGERMRSHPTTETEIKNITTPDRVLGLARPNPFIFTECTEKNTQRMMGLIHLLHVGKRKNEKT